MCAWSISRPPRRRWRRPRHRPRRRERKSENAGEGAGGGAGAGAGAGTGTGTGTGTGRGRKMRPRIGPRPLPLHGSWKEKLLSAIPFGLGVSKPRHFRDMAQVLLENRDNLPYALRI